MELIAKILVLCVFFRESAHHHPVLYLRGVKKTDIAALLDFMYHGEARFDTVLVLSKRKHINLLVTACQRMIWRIFSQRQRTLK